MTEKRFTIKEFSTLDAMEAIDVICDNGIELPSSTACDLLNSLYDEKEELKNRLSKIQSKYDKSKTDEVHVIVETENTVLLNKNEFEEYVRRHNELKRRNKRRKEKNRKYRNELKKRLREINGLKDFVQEDLNRDDKVLKGFIEEYL